MNECHSCYQPIPWTRTLCHACEADEREAREAAGDAERVFRERQARAAAVE